MHGGGDWLLPRRGRTFCRILCPKLTKVRRMNGKLSSGIPRIVGYSSGGRRLPSSFSTVKWGYFGLRGYSWTKVAYEVFDPVRLIHGCKNSGKNFGKSRRYQVGWIVCVKMSGRVINKEKKILLNLVFFKNFRSLKNFYWYTLSQKVTRSRYVSIDRS